MITYVKGDLLKALKDGEIDYMVHCCNAQGVMGSGIAKQVKEQFPKAYKEYMEDYYGSVSPEYFLGTFSEAEGVINLVSQERYGNDGKRYTNYGALARGLSDVYFYILQEQLLPKGKLKIGIPYKMASDRGGADWEIVLELVEHLLSWADVYIYEWEKL